MFCKHDYEPISETILKSAFEQVKASNTMTAKNVSDESLAAFFRKKLIILMKCPKCKKTKVIVEVNP